MINIPPPTIPTTPPEPLTLQTALFSLEGIRKIFTDQKGFYQKFEPIIISCPFAMLDNTGLEKDVYKLMAIDKQGIFKKLKVIHEWADGNMKFYEQHIRGREFENPEPWEKYYSFCNDQVYGTGFMSANGFPIAEEIVKHPDNKQSREYPTLYWFYDFCKNVHKFTSDFLSETVEPDQPTAQVNTEQQLKSLKEKTTAAQIGLFFYYLAEGKHIARPVASDFRNKNFHKEEPYNFNKSGNTVYGYFIHPQITKPNLAAIIPMLEKYPAGKKLAQQDEYSLNIE